MEAAPNQETECAQHPMSPHLHPAAHLSGHYGLPRVTANPTSGFGCLEDGCQVCHYCVIRASDQDKSSRWNYLSQSPQQPSDMCARITPMLQMKR